jgi:hypothetical protein
VCLKKKNSSIKTRKREREREKNEKREEVRIAFIKCD